ncbi:MAG: electron transport complex subunit RsxC [Clostridia bacterium]|nr:electron transport complex subunit RsxC [Clostridia bacterium]
MSSGKHLKGVHVNHCKNTAGVQIIPMALPEKVYIPMSMHIGAPCKPLVAVGDHVKVGQLIANCDAPVSAPIHSSVSGDVEAIEVFMTQNGRPDTNIIIKVDGKQEIAETVKPPVINSKEDFVKAVRDSGLVGLGGASFPMSIKYNTKPGQVDTLILNGAECEPYITVDHAAMLAHAQEMVDGMRTAMKWLGIARGVIGIESNKPDAIAKFKSILSGADDIKVCELRQIYPQGAERVIIYETTGRHLIAGKLPADVGCIVSNVTSMLKLQQFLATGMPLVTKFLTVDGNAIARPQNVEVPIGTMICDLIEFCGGIKEGVEVKKILLGGPMMGRAIPRDDFAILKSNNAVLCFDGTFAQQNKETACINCGRCVNGCPMNLMPARLSRAYKDKNVDMLREYNVMTCMDCGCCTYSCPARKQLNFEIKQAKLLVMEDDKKKKAKAEAEAKAAEEAKANEQKGEAK